LPGNTLEDDLRTFPWPEIQELEAFLHGEGVLDRDPATGEQLGTL